MNEDILIYIAGPLYTPGERIYLEELANQIEKLGFKTYLPHRDAGLAKNITDDEKETIFNANIRKLDEADMFVAVLNGLDVDSGTAFEMGYCFMQNKPIFGLIEDIRIENPHTNINLMITHSTKIFQSRDSLINEFQMIIRKNSVKKSSDYPLHDASI